MWKMCRVKSPQNGRKELAETKRNQNELKQNEECAWLTEKKCKCLGGGREGEETFAHCGQKLENANKCKLAIFISLSPRVFFFAFSEFFFLALLLRCHVTNSSREVCSFHPLSLSVSLPPCLPLLPGDSYSKVFWSLAFKVSHLYGIFMRSYECD